MTGKTVRTLHAWSNFKIVVVCLLNIWQFVFLNFKTYEFLPYLIFKPNFLIFKPNFENDFNFVKSKLKDSALVHSSKVSESLTPFNGPVT